MKNLIVVCLLSATICIATTSETLGVVMSDFESGNVDGWTVSPDGSVSRVGTGGNPGGYLRVDDDATGGHNWIYAPVKFLGDWSSLEGEILSVDAKAIFGEPTTNNMHFEISGPGGSAIHDMGQMPTYNWETYATTLTPANWTVSAGNWPAILTNVTMLRIEAEYYTGDDACAFDNIILTPEPGTLSLLALGGLLSMRRRRA